MFEVFIWYRFEHPQKEYKKTKPPPNAFESNCPSDYYPTFLALGSREPEPAKIKLNVITGTTLYCVDDCANIFIFVSISICLEGKGLLGKWAAGHPSPYIMSGWRLPGLGGTSGGRRHA